LYALATAGSVHAQTQAAPTLDPLGRENPRSAVTGFLQTSHDQNYVKAAGYLDLRRLSSTSRATRGPELARQLEAILNSAPDFNVLRLTRNPEGDPSDTSDPKREHVVNIAQGAGTVTLDLEKVTLQKGAASVWLFSSDTVAAIPELTPSAAPPGIAHFLPGFLVHDAVLETPLWKWLAFILAVMLLISLGKLFDHLLRYGVRTFSKGFTGRERTPIVEIAISPVRLVLTLAVLRIAVQFIAVSAIARLYIGRALQLVVIWVIAQFLIRLVELLLSHLENVLDARQQYASRSMLHLARRAAVATIVVLAILILLSNWGYNTTTIVAGLGVGGIAVALAAQQTIANVFGGVSIIGDQPVRIGDYGKFGDLIGTVEDIGMRSTRIRTPARTVVSIPNSSFAGLNIENYTLRDKMPFDTTLAIKGGTAQEQVGQLTEALKVKLESNNSVEAGKSTIRVTGLTSSAINVEVFCYVRTTDWDQFYSVQGVLFLAINEVLKSTKIELA
jgi:MscS family membrane protein